MSLRLLICVALLLTPVAAINVLLFPANINSHGLYFGRMAQALAQESHNVTLMMASNAKVASWLKETTGVTILKFNVAASEPFIGSALSSEMLIKVGMSESVMDIAKTWKKFMEIATHHQIQECDSLFASENIMKTLKEDKFDLAVVDVAGAVCNFLVPYKIEIPYTTFSVGTMNLMMRVPALPSFVPALIQPYSDKMTFFQRANNLFSEIVALFLIDSSTEHAKKYVPEKLALTQEQLLQNTKFWFVLRENVVNYPTPSMPNMVDVGDLICQPAHPLPSDLQTYMDEATEGVILVSLGTVFEHIPDQIRDKFCDVFSQVTQKVLWKADESASFCKLSGNVKRMNWVPQNDILAHKNLRLFIFHCGVNSMIEAIYHAVPIVAFPISVDQPSNAEMVRSHGYGEIVNFKNFTVDTFVKAINNVLESDSIRENVQKGSSVIRHKSLPAAKRISFWVNHVHKFGGEHLRTAAFDLNVMQFLMMDIFLFIVLVFMILLLVCCCISYKTITLCGRCCRRKEKRKVDWNITIHLWTWMGGL